MSAPFHVTIGHLYYFSGKISIPFSCPCFKLDFLLLLLMSCISYFLLRVLSPYRYMVYRQLFPFHRLPFSFLLITLLLCRLLVYVVSLVDFQDAFPEGLFIFENYYLISVPICGLILSVSTVVRCSHIDLQVLFSALEEVMLSFSSLGYSFLPVFFLRLPLSISLELQL